MTDSTALTTVTATSANSTGSTGVLQGSFLVDAKGNVNITYATTYTSSGATALVYKLKLTAEAL